MRIIYQDILIYKMSFLVHQIINKELSFSHLHSLNEILIHTRLWF